MDPKTKISWSRISWSRILSFPLRERSERVGLSACVKHGHVVQSTHCYWLVQSVESCLMEDDLWWKMTSVGRWPLWMTDELWCSKRRFRSIFLRSSSSLRLSQCLMSYSFLRKMTSCGWLFSIRLGNRHILYIALMEDDLRWRRTFDGRRPLMKEDHWWKTTFEGRWPQREDDFYGRRPKTTFDGGPPLMEDSLWWKMTFDGRWPSIL